MSVGIVSTGNWEIDTDNLIKVDGIPETIEEDTDVFGTREFPYIAIPFSATMAEEEDILYWGKSQSLPEDKLFDGGQYRVYQVRIKSEYVKRLADDLFKAKGFFLVREAVKA